MIDWYTGLDGLWGRAWALLQAGGAHRFATLASLGAQGPEARMVVLRRASPSLKQLVIYTDLASTKVTELRADPRASLHHWTASDRLQIRLRGLVEIATGPDVQPDWEALPDDQRPGYGVAPPPGSPIPEATDFERIPQADRFAKLTFQAEALDILHLGPDSHRRALFAQNRDWQGQWCVP